MRRTVAEFLEPRLCRDAIRVVLTPVAADGIAMLRAGFVWSVGYDQGRLLGEVGLWDLCAGGHLEAMRAWAAAGGPPSDGLRRAILDVTGGDDGGGGIDRSALVPYDRALLVLLDHAAGRATVRAELAAIAAAATPDDARWLGELPALLAARPADHRRPLTDEPIATLPPDREIDLYDCVATGDLDGARAALAAAIARAVAQDDDRRPRWTWPRLAAVTRLLTGDDAAAMALLERARFADVRDEWVEIFGPAGAARVDREKREVLAAIDAAFDGVPFPGPRHRSLFQAEAADSYRGCDQSRDHTGRWQDLPREHLLACQWALPHLGADSLPYYLPAIMSFAVREHDVARDDHGSRWIFESLEYHLRFDLDDGGLRAYAKDRHRRMTPAQLGAIARFADYYRSRAEDRARWHALARGGAWPEPGT